MFYSSLKIFIKKFSILRKFLVWLKNCLIDLSRLKKKKMEYSKKPTVKKHISKKHLELKKQVLIPISKKITNSNVLKCNCPRCPEKMIEFLSIDHIDGREKMGHVGWSTETLYYWIRRQLEQGIVPDGLQVLCHNCNWAKGRYGKCPHQK